MAALGRTNAPVAISGTSGVDGEDGLDVSTTLAKWVGTEILGGEPITSCVYPEVRQMLRLTIVGNAHYPPLAVGVEFWEVERDGEDVDVRGRGCQSPAPILQVRPV